MRGLLAILVTAALGAWPAAASPQRGANETPTQRGANETPTQRGANETPTQRGANETPTADADAPAFGETVDVQLVNVEVWVTDARGEPVTGLGIDDFEVREDGKRVDISNFAEIRAPDAADTFAPAALVEAPLEPPVAERKPLVVEELTQESGQTAGTGTGFLALYFDELFSKPAGRKQLIEDLRTFVKLRRVPPERVLILRQDQGLKVEANLGSGPAELEAALDRLEAPSARGLQTWAEEKQAFRRVLEAWEEEVNVTISSGSSAGPNRDACDSFPEKAFRAIRYHIEASRGRIAETLDALTETAGFLAGLPGPKTLIYVSDGLALAPGKDLMGLVKSLCQGRQDDRRLDYLEGMGEGFRRLSRHANANRVTIYTIQALGLRSNLTATSATERGVTRTFQALTRYNSESKTQQQLGLSYLADETGGRAVLNRGRFIEELEQIAEDMNGFYSLAYAPRHAGDGREHKIEVKVRAPQLRGEKLRVRHRPGYRDKSQDQRMIERLNSALYLNLMTNPLKVRLGAGAITTGKKKRKKTLTVPLHVRVPVSELTFLPQRGGELASLRVLVLTRDQRTAKSSFKQEGYRLARPKGTDPNLTVSLVIELDLEAGVHAIAFGIRDEATQVASFVATGVDLRQPEAAEGP